MARRVGFPDALRGVPPLVRADASIRLDDLPDVWMAWGRGHRDGFAVHTFVDDYRQECFWRRPHEGALFAVCAHAITAPDFSVFADDPLPWASHQVWRSRLIASWWQQMGARVLPVVTFACSGAFVEPGVTWAVRGPRAGDVGRWLTGMHAWADCAEPAGLLVFGRLPRDHGLSVPVRSVPLASSKCRAGAAQNEGGRYGRA